MGLLNQQKNKSTQFKPPIQVLAYAYHSLFYVLTSIFSFLLDFCSEDSKEGGIKNEAKPRCEQTTSIIDHEVVENVNEYVYVGHTIKWTKNTRLQKLIEELI